MAPDTVLADLYGTKPPTVCPRGEGNRLVGLPADATSGGGLKKTHDRVELVRDAIRSGLIEP